jgi:hypothetical protein
MKRLLFTLFLVSVGASGEPLQCDVGPINQTYGAAAWLVYSCRDGKSVVIVSAPGSSAMPFYFMFSAEGPTYRLVGEGTGSKEITDRVLAELKALRKEDITALVRQTQEVAKH